MRGLGALLLAVAALAGAAACMRLGFWQLARWNVKHRANQRSAERLAQPPREAASLQDLGSIGAGARVRLSGRFEASPELLLSARMHAGEPGVAWLSPFRLASGERCFVERGWLPAADSRTAGLPVQARDTGLVALTGRLEWPQAGPGSDAWQRLESPDDVWSAEWLSEDSARARLGSAIVPPVVRLLPEPGAPPLPVRERPEPLNESMHFGYAIQWFGFAALFGVGAAAAGLRACRRRDRKAA